MNQGSTTLVLNKIETAEVLLNESVFLFFDKASPVILEVLVGATLDILRPLAKREKIKSILFDNIRVPLHERKNWGKTLKKPYTFFKHADQDPDATIEYSDKTITHLLFDACYLSIELSKLENFQQHSSPSSSLLFVNWFKLKHPQFLLNTRNPPSDFSINPNPDIFAEWRTLASCFRKTPYAEGYKGSAFPSE